jgi:hypothetical protein
LPIFEFSKNRLRKSKSKAYLPNALKFAVIGTNGLLGTAPSGVGGGGYAPPPTAAPARDDPPTCGAT